MTVKRRRESLLRLETLGHLSDHYSGVANMSRESIAGSIDVEDSNHWELGSDSSGDSTDAVIFVKALPPPPPGLQAEKPTGSQSARLGLLDGHPGTSERGEDRVLPASSPLAKKPYVVRSETSEPQIFNTAQLTPAKSLRKIQHPAALTPGFGSRSEYDNGSSPVIPALSAAVKPTPMIESSEAQVASINELHPATTAAGPSGTVRECHDQSDRTLRRHTIHASGSLCQSPSTYQRGDSREEDGDAHRNYSMASSRRGRYSTREAGFTPENNQLLTQAQPPPRNTVSVDGVEFEVVSPLPPASIATTITTSTPAPAPDPPAEGGRGRSQKPAASPHPRSRSASPAYGAWQSDHPRQRRRSFLERAQARLQNSLHEQLVKAGRRPLPSFKVNSVIKSPSGGGGTRYEGKRYLGPVPPPPVPPVTKEAWLARIEKLTRPARAQERESAGAIPAEMKGKGKCAERDIEDEAAPFYAQERPSWALRNPSSMHAPNSALTPPTPEKKRGTANLRIVTDAPNFSRPVVREALTPESYEYKSSSDDSLFLGHAKSGPRNPAGYSFFSSDYAQKRVAADIERGKESQQQQKQRHSSAQAVAASLSRENNDGKTAESRKSQTSIPLSREQLGFAALPSALEDLWRPFPFDDRRGLPSQAKPQEGSSKRIFSL
ncbi:hypothetical protein F5B17DRAFT_360013 [Nemania serpens]|nr:hypothetical protein F5B17DRAFT_360013 [Nemania serpens]